MCIIFKCFRHYILCSVMMFILFGVLYICFFFFFKQKTAYEMRISDWSSDVCSSDLKLKLYATMDNFLNFLDQDWNVQRRRNFVGLQDIATLEGIDDQGRYIIDGFNGIDAFNGDNQINTSSSAWRLKVGVSYEF